MSQDSHGRPARYQVLVLTLWEEGGSFPGDKQRWRFSLEQAHGVGRKGFKSLSELMDYLEAWTQTPGPGLSEATRRKWMVTVEIDRAKARYKKRYAHGCAPQRRSLHRADAVAECRQDGLTTTWPRRPPT